MSDSDDEEFLSASEGEYEDDKDDIPQAQSLCNNVESEQDPVVPVLLEEKPLANVTPLIPVQESSSSSEECEVDVHFNDSSSSRDSGSEKSLPTDKKQLLEQVVLETQAMSIDGEVPVRNPTNKRTECIEGSDLSADSERSHGWDEFEAETAAVVSKPAVTITKEVASEKLEPADTISTTVADSANTDATLYYSLPTPSDTADVEPHKKDSTSSKQGWESVKEAVDVDEDTSGWDDWGDEKKPAGLDTPQNDGWEDWSLIDEKKVKKDIPDSDNADAWLQEPSKQIAEKKPAIAKKNDVDDSGWGWGGLVSAVGDTFTSTIESSLGFPSPAEMAQRTTAERKRREVEAPAMVTEKQDENATATSSSHSQPLASGFSMLSGLVSGGIDVLETIGKKTFEAVTVTDPKGSGRRRMMFSEEKGQNLSDVLKELRQQQEKEQTIGMAGAGPQKAVSDVASLFERSEGMAHLEALEMLSNNRGKANPKFEREYLAAIAAVDTESSDDSDFAKSLEVIIKRIGLPYEPKALVNNDKEIDTRLSWCDGKPEDELFEEAVRSLVDYTAASVQVVSKLSNLLLIMGGETDWRHFVSLYCLLAQRLNHIAGRYTEVISFGGDQVKSDDLSTQVLVEASTALDFIRQSLRLLTPMFLS